MIKPRDFTEPERMVFDALQKHFGVLKAARGEFESPESYFQRVQDSGMLRTMDRAALKNVKNYSLLKAAEDAGAIVHVSSPEPPPGLTFKKPRTLDEYRVAVKAGEVAGKPVRYE